MNPGAYLVIDESMNQWLGCGMPNIKKVPRKPHPIGQEFKTIADCHTNCILRLDTVSDPCLKKFDGPNVAKLVATVKRLCEPWFSSGRTIIADSWFGKPEMVTMLQDHGLFSIMQVVKRAYWPRGMPRHDMMARLGIAYGSVYSTLKTFADGKKIFLCLFRDRKTKAIVSSCSTTRLVGMRRFFDENRRLHEVPRPQVFEDYETHKSKILQTYEIIIAVSIYAIFLGSVDTANNRRDNLISFHDVIITERWEMRFFAFLLGIAEANVFSCYKIWGRDGGRIAHGAFKDHLAFALLQHCKSLVEMDRTVHLSRHMQLRYEPSHILVRLTGQGAKRVRRVCTSCRRASRFSGQRVQTRCSCNTDPLCKNCHVRHLERVWASKRGLD